MAEPISADPPLTEDELRTLSEDELVALLMERLSTNNEEQARFIVNVMLHGSPNRPGLTV